MQLFFALEHSEDPLQELTPEQCTLAISAAKEVLARPDVIIIAAAAAKAEPVNLFILKFDLLLTFLRAAPCCLQDNRPACGTNCYMASAARQRSGAFQPANISLALHPSGS